MVDHADYLPGEAPTAHASTHEASGSDEVSVAGLAGEPATLTTHKALASVHHTKYTDGEAYAAAFALAAIMGTL